MSGKSRATIRRHAQSQKRAQEWQAFHATILPPPPGASHYFKVFRIGDDVCAKCGKTRAEHPKRAAK